MATVGGIDPNFTGQMTGGEPPYARVPKPVSLFTARARRFATVAVGSDIGDYLSFLSQLSEAQARTAEATPTPPLPDVTVALENRMPPLTRDLAQEPGMLVVLDRLLAELSSTVQAEGPAAAIAKLAASDPAERQRLVTAIVDGYYELDRLAECALAAAAVQVWYALHAAQLDAGLLRNVGETACPCCGGAPASSMVVGWPEAQGNRYLACATCLTMWNHVRVKCTACGATKGISYRSIEGGTGEIMAEVCETCHGYAKHLVQTKNPALDPFADDVASYGLDMMLRDEGWRRTSLDPFLILP